VSLNLEIRTYQKENTIKPAQLLKESLKAIYDSRFLSRQLATRDIKAQYRQSYFGILWAFITPLTTAFVWIFLNQSGIIQLTDTGVPYPVYAFTGTIIWSIIIDAINAPMQSTNGARAILTKINFPKEALIVSGIYKLLFNSLIKIVLIIVFLVIYGVPFQSLLFLFPLALIGIIFFGTTIGLLLTPIGLLYNDVGKFIGLGMRFMMYAAPVVYMIPSTGFMKTVMEWNPFTPLVTITRGLLIGSPMPYLDYYMWILIICIPLFFVVLVIYRISIPVIAERLSA
jgi:lipopolysaccharide transport system permease protein